VPAVSTVATGQFRATIANETSITYELTYSGLEGTVTQAHIHFGQKSVTGGISLWLRQTATNKDPTNLNSAKLRNAAETALGNTRILEFPTSPFISGKIFCTSNSDGDRRDNSPRSAGEVEAGGAGARGKISCMDQELTIPGLPLPVH